MSGMMLKKCCCGGSGPDLTCCVDGISCAIQPGSLVIGNVTATFTGSHDIVFEQFPGAGCLAPFTVVTVTGSGTTTAIGSVPFPYPFPCTELPVKLFENTSQLDQGSSADYNVTFFSIKTPGGVVLEQYYGGFSGSNGNAPPYVLETGVSAVVLGSCWQYRVTGPYGMSLDGQSLFVGETFGYDYYNGVLYPNYGSGGGPGITYTITDSTTSGGSLCSPTLNINLSITARKEETFCGIALVSEETITIAGTVSLSGLAPCPLVPPPSDPSMMAAVQRQLGGCRGCGDPGAGDLA